MSFLASKAGMSKYCAMSKYGINACGITTFYPPIATVQPRGNAHHHLQIDKRFNFHEIFCPPRQHRQVSLSQIANLGFFLASLIRQRWLRKKLPSLALLRQASELSSALPLATQTAPLPLLSTIRLKLWQMRMEVGWLAYSGAGKQTRKLTTTYGRPSDSYNTVICGGRRVLRHTSEEFPRSQPDQHGGIL
jgi:hypothetical protein